jgi:hypothetical protein
VVLERRKTMWRKLTGVLAVIALMVPAVSVVAEDSNPFVGAWESFDPPPDGSHNRMVGGNLHIVYHEDGLTACDNAYDQFVGGTETAVGEVNGSTLSFDLVVSCNLRGEVNKTVGTFDAEFVYYSPTDTLTATDGIGLDARGFIGRGSHLASHRSARIGPVRTNLLCTLRMSRRCWHPLPQWGFDARRH